MQKLKHEKIYNKKNIFSLVDPTTLQTEYNLFKDYFTCKFNVYNFLENFAITVIYKNNEKIYQGIIRYGYPINDLNNLKVETAILIECLNHIIEDVKYFDKFLQNLNINENEILNLFKNYDSIIESEIVKKVEIDFVKVNQNINLKNLNQHWIRLFGVLIANSQLFITGGTIKLTDNTQGTFLGQIEDDKMNDAYIEFKKIFNI